MMCSLLHPGLQLILAGLVIPFLRGTPRIVFVLLIPVIALISIWNMEFGQACTIQYLDSF